MKKIGITGQNGFIGRYLANTLRLYPNSYEVVLFENSFFDKEDWLYNFVDSCDVIVHLAGMNRHENEQKIYDTNIYLTQKLISALEKTEGSKHVIFSSSTQEEHNNLYGKSKKESRNLLKKWSEKNNNIFTGLIIPNVFGPFGKPNYNSFINTFCHKILQNETPKIINDNEVNLIFIGELVSEIIGHIERKTQNSEEIVHHTTTLKVSDILYLLKNYNETYVNKYEIPVLKNAFEINLFNTFRSFINYKNFYPVKFTQNIDNRGAFVEIIRLGIGGQCSFSTTVSGITRGNHFHTRKIERFAVIKGSAQIQLRKTDCDEVLNFYLDGNEPSFVDMPIWYTHNIKNIGTEDLYTIFWINEPYNADDPDTYFLDV